MTLRRFTLLLLAAALLTPCRVAAGADDGGLRSPFALGAGNRALGLGGAYVAVADDASAALWNPAGLAALERRRFEASHTALFGMGFGETYFSFVLPHWRWGNTSLTLRQFGTDGIEQRDDRNLLLADDLQDSETELVVAHARTLRPGLDVGAGLKLQHQTLAGYSGGGYGLDVGVLLRPLILSGAGNDAWSVGLAVRNLLEPKIRLDQESVPDPRALRFGAAYRRPLAADIAGLASLDFEKTAGMGTRVHLGAEADYRGQAALRFGLLSGSLTAGLGVRWHDVRVDFAFEDHRFGAVKRVGLTLLQGPSVSETRAAALARAEAERRAQLAETFAESERQRRRELLDAVHAALDAGDYETARGRVDMMLVLDPGDADVHALERRVLTAQARAEQDAGDIESALITLGRLCALDPDNAEARRNLDALHVQDAARTERSREIQQLYADGLDAFAVDDYDTARSRFVRALELAPEDADVRAMLARVDRAVAQRLTVRIDEVRSLSRAGLVEEALAARDVVRLLGADAAVLDELDRSIDEARTRRDFDRRRREDERQRQAVLAFLSSQVEPEPTPATSEPVPETTVVSAARRAELDALAQRARDVYAAGQVAEAVRLWELIWSEDPQDDETRDALRQEYLSHGMEHFSAGRLADAVDSWENALRIDPDDRRTRSYLDRGRQQLMRIRRLQEESGR